MLPLEEQRREDSSQLYAAMILEQSPRALSQMDRDAMSPTAGCCDRAYWAWKFVDFPGARFQEALCALSFLYATQIEGNPYFQNARLLEWIGLGLRFWSSIQHRDGSFDEAYPFERSLAATAFTTFYVGEALEFLGDDLSPDLRARTQETMRRAGRWLIRNDRSLQYGIQAAHLELIGANYLDLHKDLTLARDSSWAQFTIAWVASQGTDDGGKYYVIDDRDPNKPVVQMGSRTRYLRQYFKYVRRGAVRIDAASDNPDFEPLAFVNADCRQTVIVKAGAGGNFSVQGFPAGSYGVKYTTDAQYDVDNADVTINAGQSLQTAIPGPGVITVYAKTVNCAPLVNVSAANYRKEELSVASIVAVFGKNLANQTMTARETPLPFSLDGTSVSIKDSHGAVRPSPLFFVSPYQINYQISSDTAPGPATVSVTHGAEVLALSSVSIKQVAPGLFTADATGGGLPAAVALRAKA
ncbi:MAG TPA: hypothetical protein VKG02_11185, partial [Blastocatellia bacterium]|nr:hypothetical protein [Blastocatellia bacterium]